MLQLTWAAVATAQSYRVYWSTDPLTGINPAAFIEVDAASLLHTGLTNAVPYHYVVTALNTAGESAPSASISGEPGAANPETDPLLSDQWHLNNLAWPGEDVDVMPVWNTCAPANSCRGEGVQVAVVDDGLEVGHEDLFQNVATGESHDYVNSGSDPTGGSHGTMAAGLIAARDLNGRGLSGVAPRASLVGLNAVASGRIQDLADAMTRGDAVAVRSNSWGSPDGRADLQFAPQVWRSAIETGLAQGRAGLGTLYVWAAGNGALAGDNANYDGYANHRGVIAVAALGPSGQRASYSEPGANLWLSAPGGTGSCSAAGRLATTDRSGAEGLNAGGAEDYSVLEYTRCLQGTSAAAPLVSGVAALMLQTNPALGWRDVRIILAQSARRNDATHADWQTNAAGYNINHTYGFGAVDAAAAVALAESWTDYRSGAPSRHVTPGTLADVAIPDNEPTGITSALSVTSSGITEIEWVEIIVSADHPYSGDLDIELTGPSGTVSRLAETHACWQDNCTPYLEWIFGSARYLGEPADGTWTLAVRDLAAQDAGRLDEWQLIFHGR